MDSVSRQTPRHQRIVNVKRRRSEDDAFNDEEDDECGDAEFSLRNPPLTDGQKAPSTAFNSMKILASSTNAKTTSSHQRSRKKPPNHLLQLRQTHHHHQQQQQQQQPSSCSVGRSVRMQRFESTSNTTTRNIAKQMMLLQEGETPTTSTVSSSDKETPGLDLRRHSMSNPPTTGRFRRRRNGGGDGNTSEPHTEDRLPPSTEAAVRRRQRRRQLEAHPVGDYNLSPGEHGGSQYILSPGHESEGDEEDIKIGSKESKDFLAALREEEDDVDVQATTTTTTSAAVAARKEHKRMAVLNNQPSLEVDSNGGFVSNVGGNKSRVFFPIFSKGQKTVHLVRHGQSTYNEAISGPGSWEEPKIFDARLTKLGIEQAKELGKFLSELPKDAVWITSPLTRAMETCVYGREAMYAFVSPSSAEDEKNSPDENVAPPNNSNDSNTNNNNSNGNTTSRRSSSASSRKKVSTKKKVATRKENEKQRHEAWGRSVIVRPEITEKLSCSGDIGRTKLELIEDIPIFAQSLSKLPDKSWWWDTNNKRNDAGEKVFNSDEPTRVFQRRVDKFRQWILSHPSTTFVVFGHSTFFKEMVGRSLKNCEVASIQL